MKFIQLLPLLVITISLLSLGQDTARWEIEIGDQSCFAFITLDVGDKTTGYSGGTIILRAAIPHSGQVKKFEELFSPEGENFLLAAQYVPSLLDDEIRAEQVIIYVSGISYPLHITHAEGFRDFVFSGDLSRALWQRLRGERAILEVQLSNESKHEMEIDKKHLENVARMLEVCPH